MPSYDEMKRGYYNLWNRAKIRPERLQDVRKVAALVLRNRERYARVEAVTGVPWYWIGLTHNLEGGGRFDTYLGNGQRLNAVTTIAPKGRGPFATFEDGAIDALRLKKIVNLSEGTWTIAYCLYQAERFNGFGYVSRKINSPYLWSFTTLYERGKYIRDGVYSATAVSSQVGFAAALKALIEMSGDDDMSLKLQATVSEASVLAPTLLRLLAGAGARIATRALAGALVDNGAATAEPKDANEVNSLLEGLPLATFKAVIAAAEDLVSDLAKGTAVEGPQEAPVKAEELVAPVVVAPTPSAAPAPSTGFLDRIIPAGLKTPIGILIYVAGTVLPLLGYVTPDIGNAIATVGGGLIGVGLLAKVERYMPLLTGIIARR